MRNLVWNAKLAVLSDLVSGYGEINNWFMLSVRTSSYGCTREVWRAREKRKSCSRRSREQL